MTRQTRAAELAAQRPQLNAHKHGGVLARLFTPTPKSAPSHDRERAHGFRGHCLSRPGDQR